MPMQTPTVPPVPGQQPPMPQPVQPSIRPQLPLVRTPAPPPIQVLVETGPGPGVEAEGAAEGSHEERPALVTAWPAGIASDSTSPSDAPSPPLPATPAPPVTAPATPAVPPPQQVPATPEAADVPLWRRSTWRFRQASAPGAPCEEQTPTALGTWPGLVERSVSEASASLTERGPSLGPSPLEYGPSASSSSAPPPPATVSSPTQNCDQQIGWTPSFHSLPASSPGSKWNVPAMPGVFKADPAATVAEEEEPAGLQIQRDEPDSAELADECLRGDEVPAFAQSLLRGPTPTPHASYASLAGSSPASPEASQAAFASPAESLQGLAAAHERAASHSASHPGTKGRASFGAAAELRRLATSEALLMERLEESQARVERLEKDLDSCQRGASDLRRENSDLRRENADLRYQLEQAQRNLESEQARRTELSDNVRKHQESNRSLDEELQRASEERHKLEAQLEEAKGERISAEGLAKSLQSKLAELQQEVPSLDEERRQKAGNGEVPRGIEEQLDHMRRQLEATVSAMKLQRASQVEGTIHECTDAAPEEELVSTEVQLMGEWGPSASPATPATPATPGVPAALWGSAPMPALRCESQNSVQSLDSTASGTASGSFVGKGQRRGPPKNLGAGSRREGSRGSSRSASVSVEPRTLDASSPSASCSVATAAADRSECPTPHTRAQVEDSLESGMGLISMRDLCEIKALKKPPPPIRMLMEVCCLLFGIEPVRHLDDRSTKGWRIDYWEPARRSLLSDPFFLSKLRSYDEELAPLQKAKIRKYFQDPEFTADRVRNCSKAAFELFVWVSRVLAQQPDHPSPRKSVASPLRPTSP